MAQTIRCPKCGTEIPLDDALTHKFREDLRQEFDAKAQEQERIIATRAEELAGREKQLAESRKSIENEVNKRVALARAALEEDATRKAAEAVAVEVKDLKAQVVELAAARQEAEKHELDIRKRQRDLESAKRNLELEIGRRLDEERQKVRDESVKAIEEKHRLKDLEKDKKLADLTTQLTEMQRRVEQGSQQAQGEALELDLEQLLKDAFPLDAIEPVPKGTKGADVTQRICDRSGRACGTIIWEAKRTKAWSEGWIQKLKDDQRELRADIALLLTTTLPKGIDTFASRDGVWVTSHACAIGLACALRESLIQVAAARVASAGKQGKMELLYDYLSGADFRLRIEAIVEAFMALQSELDAEKRTMTKVWAAREKQIERVLQNTAGMYGDLQGISGAALPKIEHLELKAIPVGGARHET